MSIADKLNKLLNTKYAIKHAIMNKGVDIDDDTKFSDYPSKIDAIITGGGGDSGNGSYYEKLWNTATNDMTFMNSLFSQSVDSIIDISNLNTTYVTDMGYLFQYNDNLIAIIGIEEINTSNVTTMRSMFNGCSNLTTLDLSNFNTSNVTDMENMFSNCRKLSSLNINNWDISKVTNISGMFSNCVGLTTLNVNHFDTSSVTKMSSMFSYCSSLTSLDCSNWDISKVTGSYDLGSAFNSCTSLVDFKAPKNISANMDVKYSTVLSHDSLMSIINNLITTTSTKTLTLGTTNLAKLTADEKAIATGKGWTLK